MVLLSNDDRLLQKFRSLPAEKRLRIREKWQNMTLEERQKFRERMRQN